jgi:hypothetical protein
VRADALSFPASNTAFVISSTNSGMPWYLIGDAIEQFEAGGVGPMCILKNHQQWVLARQGRNLGNECFERPLPTLFAV